MRVVELPEILAAIDAEEVQALLTEGFIRFSAGACQVMAVGHLDFAEAGGDCHVKGGHLAGDDVFVVKCSTTFYRNAELGLPSANGFVAILGARTGEVLAILHDHGQLSDIRTAITGAIAARAVARPGPHMLGIVGTGMQARLQAEWIARTLDVEGLLVWGRHPKRAEQLAAELGGASVTLDQLCGDADIIVTTTPSTAPLVQARWVTPGKRIIAVGADAPGKCELDPGLFEGAVAIADSRIQCIDHGECGWAIRAGFLDPGAIVELGQLLAKPKSFPDDRTVIVDLTGVGVQDVQIAKSVWQNLAHAKESA
jgi:ornithine cyclodeaminase